MGTLADVQQQLGAVADAMRELSMTEQRAALLSLLQLLDRQAGGSDEYAALLLQLGTDMRQRVALGQW
jgi:hypothetical protein